MANHIVTINTYGAGNPAKETVRNARALRVLAQELSTIDEVDTVHVQIDWSGGRDSYHDGARTAQAAAEWGWSYQ